MIFLRVWVLALIFMVDAVIALAQGNSMYTLKPTGAAGMFANAVSLIVATAIFFSSSAGRRVWAWATNR